MERLTTVSVSLPSEIEVKETAGLRRYTLPWRPMTAQMRRRFRVVLVVAAVAWTVAIFFITQAIMSWPRQGFPCFGMVSLVAGVGFLIYAIRLRYSRCTAEVGADKLKMGEWQGPFLHQRERSFEQVRTIVMHPLMSADDSAEAEAPVETGVIEIQCEGIQSLWWAHHYPSEWLAPLAAELAERCALPQRRGRIVSPAVAEPPPFVLPLVPDADTADVADRPVSCRVIVQRTPESLTLTFPPLGYWGSDQAKAKLIVSGFIFLFALMFVFVPVVQMFRHGLLGPAQNWLFVGGLLMAGPVLMLVVRHFAESQTVLSVRNGWLTRIKKSPVFGYERMRWRRAEITALRVTAAKKKSKGPPTAAVTLYPLVGPSIALLEPSARQEEMGYVATLLRRALQVPAVAGQPPSPTPAAVANDTEIDAAAPIESVPAEAAPLVRRRRQPLPPEVNTIPTPAGTNYVLPWLNPTAVLGRRGFGCALLVLVFLGFGIWLCAGAALPDWLARGGNIRMAIGGMLLFFGITGLLAFLGIVIRRDAVEISAEGLRFVQRTGVGVVRKQWPRQSIRRIETQHFAVSLDSMEAEPLGVIQIMGEGNASHSFGSGYPVSMLLPLAEEMAERLNLPHEETEPPAVDRVTKRPTSAEMEPAEEDLFDEERQPASSRAIVEEKPESLTITLPSAGYRQNRRVRSWLPFAIAALLFVALNIVAMVRLAIIGNAGLPQLLASTAWLTGSVVAAVVLTARVIHLARKRIVITAQKNFLTVVHSSPMTREKRQEWPRNEIAAIRLGYASRQLFTEKGLALCLFTKEG
ncbi:MAG TPA: hypothetical protein VGZ47_12935, partial [Gemmataceae bacterium]|nr:hypothetical protein [Gemmataceae bacterium]